MKSALVLGGSGLIGRAVCRLFADLGVQVLSVHRANYAASVGAKVDVLINCNGNTYRYRANQDPVWDFDASVATVARSLFDFKFNRYVYLSTVDLYRETADPERNSESAVIRPEDLMPYAFNKWLAEKLVQRYADRWIVFRLGTAIGPGLKKNPVHDLMAGELIHMTPESRISLIDTDTIARGVHEALKARVDHEIINLAATGNITVAALADRIGRQPQWASDAALRVHHYDINNRRMAALMPLPTCREAVEKFLSEEQAKS